MNYYHKDHLGSTRAVVDASGTILEATDYYPFGMIMDGRSYLSGSSAKEKFTGKERDDETGFDHFGARTYSSELGRFMQVDPHAANYPNMSPYAYVLNNPMFFVDPDGRDVKIRYTNEDGEEDDWVFNGRNQSEAPDNEFVQQFLEVYNHVSEMEGFEAFVSIVWDTERTVSLVKSDEGSDFTPTLNGQVNWNPVGGLEYDDRVLSPATILGHEMEHADSYTTNRTAHQNRRDRERSDGFTNDEEHRVLTGPELMMQINMGEIDNSQKPRKHGTGKSHRVKTTGPTSNKVVRQKND